MSNINAGLVIYDKENNQIIIKYIDGGNRQTRTICDLKSEKVVNDYQIVKNLYKAMEEKEGTINTFLAGPSYALKSLLRGQHFEFAVGSEEKRTYVLLPPIKEGDEVGVEEYKTENFIDAFGDALVVYNTKAREAELNIIRDGGPDR
ncbi:MAG: hypothetical protein AB7S44_02800 [Spirochaetales bacterium]